MAENETTGNCKCAREALGPWLIGIAVLICATLVLMFCYADDMRQAHKTRKALQQQARPNNQVAGVTPSQGGLGRLAAFLPPWHSQTQQDSVAVTGASPVAQSFTEAIGIVSPSVVGITTTTTTTTTTGDINSQSGSGIIVHPMGYILTNHHVIRDVQGITVSVTLGQELVQRKYQAEIVEIQPQLDLAVIRITNPTGRKFIPAPLGNSDNVMIGQQVAAIGSPFGLSQSASAGIVSNCDRTLTAGDKVFTGLIQTDASINPGSSGGALINERGEVIGINTAIYSLSMGFSGIGFAVPVNDAKRVFAPFIKTVDSPMLAQAPTRGVMGAAPDAQAAQVGGVNVRMMAGAGQANPAASKTCWLGVDILPVDSTMTREFNVPFHGGVLVNRVFKLSPSDVAGVQRGDILFRIDGQRIADQDMLWSSLVTKQSREPVQLTLFRKGKRMTVTAIMEEEPANVDILLRQGHVTPGAPPMIGEISWVGIDFQPIEPVRAQRFGIAPNLTGVVIGEVEGIAAIEAGLLPGDIVLYLNSQPVTDIGVLKNIVKHINPGEGVVLDILRRDQRFYITVHPSPLDMGAWQ